MSDNHERFQNESESVNRENEQKIYDTEATNNVNENRVGSAPQSYTWNRQTGEYSSGPRPQPTYRQPIYSQPPVNQQPMRPVQQVKPKKNGVPFGVKLLAVVLCCAITSAATLGVFIGLVQGGVVKLETKSESALVLPDEVSRGEAEAAADSAVSSVPENNSVPGTALTDQDVAEKLIPSVVCIENYQVSQQYGFLYTTSSDVSPASEGSGIIISEDGYIVTNAHVVDGATSLKAILYDGSTVEAELIGSDTLTDIAVIKVDTTGLETPLTAASFGDSSALRVADKVIAIGNPGGYELSSSVTIGYVSALNRAITNSSTGYTMEYIQTDAAINPGNSGGALVNSYGEVIGINSAKISATGYEGLGFAIPSDTAQPIINDLIQYGYVKDRAMLGISGQFIDSLTGRFYGLPQGEYVAALNTELAQSSGLQQGDVITAMDGTMLSSEAEMRAFINSKKPGEVVTLTVYRPSIKESIEISLTLSEYSGS